MGESVEIKLARFEEILRAHCASQEKITKTMFSKVDDLDERLKILETWQATTKGGWGVQSGRFAAGGNFMGGAITGGKGGPGLRTVDGAIGGSCFFSGPTIGPEGGAGTGGGGIDGMPSGTASKGGAGFIMVFEHQ